MWRVSILALSVALSTAGCGRFEQGVARFKGHSQQCVDGVVYLQFSSGATVKYRPDGKVWTCGNAASGLH